MGMTGEQAYVLAKKLIEAGGGSGGTVDAYTKTQTDNLLIQKVDKEAGKGLFSGSYNDLSDAPTIPSKTSELQNDSGYLTEHQDLTDYATKSDLENEVSGLKGDLTEISRGVETNTFTKLEHIFTSASSYIVNSKLFKGAKYKAINLNATDASKFVTITIAGRKTEDGTSTLLTNIYDARTVEFSVDEDFDYISTWSNGASHLLITVDSSVVAKADKNEKDIESLNNDVNSILDTALVSITDKIIRESTINSSGEIIDATGTAYARVDYTDVSAYDKIYITADNCWGNYLYCFYNADLSLNSLGSKAESSGTPTRIVELEVNVPKGAKYVIATRVDFSVNVKIDSKSLKKSAINNTKGITWCAFGDSLTDSATLENNQSGTKNYVDIVSESLGLIATNCGKAGTGYMRTNGNSLAFYDRVNTIPKDTEILTVFGSFNDMSHFENLGQFGDTSTSTIYGCMYTFFNNVINRKNDILIGVITPTPWNGYHSGTSKEHCEMYVNALIETAKSFGSPVLDLYHESNVRPWFNEIRDKYFRGDDDGLHLSELGHKKFIAPRVENFIMSMIKQYS